MATSSSADLLAMDGGRWQREPLVIEAVPAEAKPIFAKWYAELALVNDAIGKPDEAAYCRRMVAEFGGVQP